MSTCRVYLSATHLLLSVQPPSVLVSCWRKSNPTLLPFPIKVHHQYHLPSGAFHPYQDRLSTGLYTELIRAKYGLNTGYIRSKYGSAPLLYRSSHASALALLYLYGYATSHPYRFLPPIQYLCPYVFFQIGRRFFHHCRPL